MAEGSLRRAPCGLQDPLIERQGFLAHPFGGKLADRPRAAGRAHPLAEAGIADQGSEGLGQGGRIAGRDQKPFATVRHRIAAAGDVGRDDGFSRRHGFEDRHRKTLAVRGQADDMASGQKSRHICHPSGPFDDPLPHPVPDLGFRDRCGITGVGPARKEESGANAGLVELPCCLDELDDPLRAQKARRKDHDRHTLGRCVLRLKAFDIHSGAWNDPRAFGRRQSPAFEFASVLFVLKKKKHVSASEGRPKHPENALSGGAEERPMPIEKVSETRNGVEDGRHAGRGGGEGSVKHGFQSEVMDQTGLDFPIEGRQTGERDGLPKRLHSFSGKIDAVDFRAERLERLFIASGGKRHVDVVARADRALDQLFPVDRDMPPDDVHVEQAAIYLSRCRAFSEIRLDDKPDLYDVTLIPASTARSQPWTRFPRWSRPCVG